ncbi:F-type H+-transporting ATPase subunit gamma [Candidatus Planktophila sulfonica]|uniref:ATP synthase gamma chain n=1 Tax=Candidatus Planktophila sulfonica TaxID=1884904 RepID=A0A249KFI9_9ACTN|nr:F0F1 ATP synthase subunit gamma [Candidatus Planktophila sulfonica]ASY15568.1 F-type H+-transporting ATPase subunit gamma [Candidatus Planktophila sulfonica]
MGAQLRIYRRRMRSVKATKKITKAMELISASRIVKAQQRVSASTPYANELTRAVSAVASYSSTNHPLTTAHDNPRRAAILIISADRGMAGAYSTNAIKEGEKLAALLRERGLQVSNFLVGRKAVNYYKFRNREMAGTWTGFSDNPTYENAKEIADALLSAFLADSTEANGVDEIHIIFTQFKSMLTQEATAKRMIPLEVVESSAPVPTGLLPMYEFEPNAGEVLNALLPRYIEARIFNAMLQSAASEHAARRRAMKSATDNAEDLIKSLTRLANAARQAEITQEISEIVGGADALASASAGSE